MSALLVAAAAASWAAAQYPGFSPLTNALSDLGRPGKSPAAAAFNVGLAVSGFLVVVDATTEVIPRFRATGILLALTGLLVQLVGVLDETYGVIHLAVSVALFVTLAAACLSAWAQAGIGVGLAAAAVIALSWLAYAALGLRSGAAVPESLSLLAAAAAYLSLPTGEKR